MRGNLESYRGALSWLIERRRPAQAFDIAWSLMWYWLIRGRAIEGLQWYEQILNLPPLPPAAESRARLGAAALRYAQGALEGARADLARAMALAHASGDRDAVVQADWILGHVEHAVGNLDAARDRFALSAEGFHALGIPWGTGSALTGLAWVALAAREAAEAERLLDEAAAALRNTGPWFLSLIAYLRAMLCVQRGHAHEAIALMRESLTRIRGLKDKFALVYALVPLAAAALLHGDDAWAARILGAQNAVVESTGATTVDRSAHDMQQDTERTAVHGSARIGGRSRTQQDARPRSMPC